MDSELKSEICYLCPFSPRHLQLKAQKKVIFRLFRVCKIFRSFSEYLDGRTAAQCRSHYQKIMIKFKTIAKLKRSYKSLFGEAQYKKEF